jgi:uncharacterized protein (TIGR03435 family)
MLKISTVARKYTAALFALTLCGPILGPISAVGMQINEPPGNRSPQHADRPSFEVASIGVVPAGHSGRTFISPPDAGEFIARNISLQLLIAIAYDADSDRITQLPKDADQVSYDIAAKPKDGDHPDYSHVKLMLQSLLEERFALVLHQTTHEVSGFELVVNKKGLKLNPSKTSSDSTYILPNGLRSTNTSLDQFAGLLTRPVGREVINRTGIQGKYDIVLSYAPANSTDSSLPSIFTALQEQLGLRLAPAKVPEQLLVIDHVNREPTPN